ncbi:MAG: crotonase/enoyl-CoA hydratase family protein [Magnetovibrio sp.]|nr:crotonase/enoyl-CoA hydratase family protein [Magnetovibrio sp.]
MSEFTTISFTVNSRGVARLTLNRPEKHNSLNAQMIAELRSALRQINTDQSIRVVVLSGAGKSFCAGADLAWMKEQITSDRAGKVAHATELALMLKDLNELNKPTIARVNGQAYGGGIGLMAVCDIVIALETAKFAMAETRLGLIPATIGPLVVARIGETATRRVALNACLFDGREAVGLGLVSEAVAEYGLDAAIDKHIDLFLQCAPGAIADTKNWIRVLAHNLDNDHLATSAQRLADRWEDEETKEGLRCFFDHTKPRWQDK